MKSIVFLSMLCCLLSNAFSQRQLPTYESVGRNFKKTLIEKALGSGFGFFNRESDYDLNHCPVETVTLEDKKEILTLIGEDINQESISELESLFSKAKDLECDIYRPDMFDESEGDLFSDIGQFLAGGLMERIGEIKGSIDGLFFCAYPGSRQYRAHHLSTANYGLKNYYSIQSFKRSSYLLPLMKFLTEIHDRTLEYKRNNDHKLVLEMDVDRLPINAFELAQKRCEGDVRCSFYIMSFFGHDDVVQNIENMFPESDLARKITRYLNSRRPGSSLLFAQGALGGISMKNDPSVDRIYQGVEKLKRLVKRFNELSTIDERLLITDYSLDKTKRLGYYHLYGATSVVLKMFEDQTETMSGAQISIEFPPFLVEAYKANNLLSYIESHNLIKMFTAMEFIDKNDKTWQRIPRRTIDLDKIDALTDRTEIVRAIQELIIENNMAHIEYAKSQHRRAAEFATEQLQEYAKANCSI
jgi:hypothetical protein